MPRALHELLYHAADLWPDRIVIENPGCGSITYRDLADLSVRVCDRLATLGVKRGDRVAVLIRKSIDAVAAIFGTMRAAAAYVPLDPNSPPARNGEILRDAEVSATVAEHELFDKLPSEVRPFATVFLEGEIGDGGALRRAVTHSASDHHRSFDGDSSRPEDPAYVFYTSGSTGIPKGVMISHRAALSFVEWCSATFAPTADDCFSSHAPFHFDLSVLDLYLAIRHGARVVLIEDAVAKDPIRLASLISERKISIWYSVPSVLMLLGRYGKLARHQYPALRLVLFAGEVFPITQLRVIKTLWPAARYFNLYGPTETNVCTFFEIPSVISENQVTPYPIGQACSHYRSMVVDGDERPVTPGVEGELCVNGAGTMLGYWKRPDAMERAFLSNLAPERWYRTGDIVIEDHAGCYTFVGRRDRMVKRRGYRVELGEVEAGLLRHPAVREAAVIALFDEAEGLRLKAFLTFNAERPSLIALRTFCGEVLPSYMIPDLFEFPQAMPRTSTFKIDYRGLAASSRESSTDGA